jgi:non-canonical poly(A) RNA polymerase PAPD5/7
MDRYGPPVGPPPSLPQRSYGSGGDSYRPPSRDRNRSYDRGYQGDLSGYRGGRAPSPRLEYPPSRNGHYDDHRHPPGNSYDSHRVDSYRPPQGDFTFRVEPPPGLTSSGRQENSHLRDFPEQARDRRFNRNRRDDRRPSGPTRGGGASRGTFRRVAANRPFLQMQNSNTTMDFVTETSGATYKDFQDLSDSDEADMDMSSDSGTEEPSKKKARKTAKPSAAEASVPKWSNPDLNTAIPPSDPSTKKKDVVELIRKARVQSKASGLSTSAGPEEFISCMSDSEGELDPSSPVKSQERKVPGAPTGPRETVAQYPTGPQIPSRSAAKNLDKADSSKAGQPTSFALKTQQVGTAAPTDLNPPRKRTHNDEIKTGPPTNAKLKKATKMPVGGFIVADWRVTPGVEPCPWLRDHSETPVMGVW